VWRVVPTQRVAVPVPPVDPTTGVETAPTE
jgi:hypothetical protein